ncbi:MAG: hypothetical protein ACREH3_20420 [Geminicoccales bacterium]
MAQAAGAFAPLRGHEYLILTAFGQQGRPVTAALPFALVNGRLFAQTVISASVVKSVRRSPRVQVAPGTAQGTLIGPGIEALARVLPFGEEDVVRQAFEQKYGGQRARAAGDRTFGVTKLIADAIAEVRGTKLVFLELVPVAAA